MGIFAYLDETKNKGFGFQDIKNLVFLPAFEQIVFKGKNQ